MGFCLPSVRSERQIRRLPRSGAQTINPLGHSAVLQEGEKVRLGTLEPLPGWMRFFRKEATDN
jgi:hypothetical protein